MIIAKKSLLGRKRADTPLMCDWELFYNCGGFYNTPNVFAIYMSGLNLALMKKNGLAYYDELAKKRSGLIYDVIDNSDGFYSSDVAKSCRSRMNVQFKLATKADDDAFVKAAAAAGFIWLNGHAKYGGCRASMYNAMPLEGAEKLAKFMK